MQTANFDHQDFLAVNESKMDERLLVRFYIKSVKDQAKTLVEGRPIFKDVEYVEIRIPGSRQIQVARPATERDKARFSRHYKAFKDRTELTEEGTALVEWPQITRSQAEELAFVNVKTVEQLATMSDTNISRFQGGYSLRTRAQEWLKSADASKLIAEKQELESKIAELEAKVESLLSQSEIKEEVKDSAKTSRRRYRKTE